MKKKTFQRLVGGLVSAALLLGAPGGQSYQVAAQTFGRSAPVESSVRVLGPAIASVSAGIQPLSGLNPSPLGTSVPMSAVPLPGDAVHPSVALPAPIIPTVAGDESIVREESPLSFPSQAVQIVRSEALNVVKNEKTVSGAVLSGDEVEQRRFFDGSAPRPSVPSVGLIRRASGFARNTLAAVVLSAALLIAPRALPAAPPAPPAAIIQQEQGVAAETPAEPQLPRPLSASVSIDRSDATVGERVQLSVTLHNPTDKTITLPGLRTALQEGLEDLEVQGRGAEAPVVLAPGQTKTLVFEAIPFAAEEIVLKDVVLTAAVAETDAYPGGIEIPIAETTIKVRSVLTPDWKDAGFRDIVGVQRERAPAWVWAAGGALGLLLLVGVERLIAARRFYPKLDGSRLSLLVETEGEIGRLKSESASLDSAAFYAQAQEVLTRFMTDLSGLPRKVRDAKTLARDLKASKAYRPEQAALAAELAFEAEAARFSGAKTTPSERLRFLARLSALVESAAGREKTPAPRAGVLGVLPFAAGLQFGSPWALLFFIPAAVYLWKALRARDPHVFKSSSSDQIPSRRTWREKLVRLPLVLRMLAASLLILALARPMVGVSRMESYTPSTDTVVTVDISGSMDDKLGDISKLQAAGEAARAYIEEQRRGTQNRVGMVTFSDDAVLDVKLTTDYDALILHLKELKTRGSTGIGKSILTSIAHFVEVNAVDLDESSDARVKPLKALLRQKGLPAALEYAKAYPDLMRKILRPDRAKIVVLFSDGESNDGIPPLEAAQIAAELGVKVYAVGIGRAGVNFDEATLGEIAKITGARYYRADDAGRMREVLLEISRLEKSPTKIVSSLAVKDYGAVLALIALLLLGAETALSNTRLRTLQAIILALALPGLPVSSHAQEAVANAPAPQIQESARFSKIPQEMLEGNRLYAQGRYDEAVKAFARGLALHPDLPELYFNMADAYLKLGDTARAEASYKKYLELAPDAARQSRVLFNLGNAALMLQDGGKALDFYKEALRRNSSNLDAKWNLEVLKQKQKEQNKKQQNQNQKNQKQKKGKMGQKGQQGQPGQQQGQQQGQQDQQGQPGDKKDGKGEPKDGQKGADRLGQKLGEQEKAQQEVQRKGLTRKGAGVWAAAFLPAASFAGHGVVFAAPWVLGAAAIVVTLVGLLIRYGLRRNLKAAQALSPGTAPKNFRSWWGARRFLVKTSLLLAALSFIGLGAADPRGGLVEERVNFGGKDLVVAVDGSHSMSYAEDGRLAKTKEELTRFIERLRGVDRVGLVVFAGDSRTASPLSIDYGNFEFKTERLETEARGLKEGSDLVGAVKYAAEHFALAKNIGERQRVLIIISDGEVDDSALEEAIVAARDRGITIYTIGIGASDGTKIRLPSENGQDSEYLIDETTGGPVVTRLTEGPLRKLAEATGGAYFRSESGTSIDSVLQAVAGLEKGDKEDLVKSPQPVGSYLVGSGLLLLLLSLLAPASSMIRRDSPRPAAKGKPGAGLLGAALVPLSAWPQILPFALLGVLAAAFLAAEVWTGGAVLRGLRQAWQRRTRFIEKGVKADLAHLYELREVDEPRLSEFLARWQGAGEDARPALLAQAAADEVLWREMLSAAYLSGSAMDTHEASLAALRRVSRERLEPLAPVVERMGLRASGLAWMSHPDAKARMDALEATAAIPKAKETAPAAQRQDTWRARLGKTATALVLLAALAASMFSAAGSARFAREQSAAEESARGIFYGEDAYVFTDRYVDEKIPQLVLPVLKRWHDAPGDSAKDLENAVSILRQSPDPKADNLLVAVFRRAALLPLTQGAETALLKALLERDSDAIWKALETSIARSDQDARAAELLTRLLTLGLESGEERTFANLFRILKSPNQQVQLAASEGLYRDLTRPEKAADLFKRLSVVGRKFASSSDLQMWTAVFSLRAMSDPKARGIDADSSREFIDQLFNNAWALDASRAALFAQAQQSLQPGQKPELPPSVLAALLSLLEQSMQDAGESASVSPAVAGMVRYAVNQTAGRLVHEGEGFFKGFHERLVKEGIAPPDEIVRNDDLYDSYSDIDRVQRQYRDVYKLSHLRTFSRVLGELSLATPTASAPPAAGEYLDRAQTALQFASSMGPRSGMLEGGSKAEAAAEALRPFLKEGSYAFQPHVFLNLLRSKGLAPAVGASWSGAAYPEALDAKGLRALREIHAEMARAGQVPGGRDLNWQEKLYLAKALDAIDAVAGGADPTVKSSPAGLLKAFSRKGEEHVAGVRLFRALLNSSKDGAFALAAERTLLARLSDRRAVPVSAEDLKIVLPVLLESLRDGGRSSEGWELLRKAVDSKRLPAETLKAIQPQAFAKLRELSEMFAILFSPQKGTELLIAADILVVESDWRGEFKLRHYEAFAEALSEGVRRASVGGGMNDRQKAFSAQARKLLPGMKSFAAKLGVAPGDSPGEIETADLNRVLHRSWALFPGQSFVESMRKNGLAKEGPYDKEKAWLENYSPSQLSTLRGWIEATLAANRWDGGSITGMRALSDEEKALLKAALKGVDSLKAALAASPKIKLHAFAPLAALALPALASWGLALLLAAAATWLIWTRAFAQDPPQEDLRAGREDLRRRRVDFASRRLADSVVGGSFRSRFVGAGGSDFAEARPYQNEDYREIDWKTSAKKGEIYAKKFELERDMPLILVVDLSRSGDFGTRGRDKREIIEETAAALALAASRANVRVGAVLFGGKVEKVFPARGGLRHASAIVDALLGAEAVGGGTDLASALGQAGGLAKSRAMVAVVSDFLAPDFKDALSSLAARHDLRAIRVQDPAEAKPLPDVGLLPVEGAETGERSILDTSSSEVRAEAAAATARREAAIDDALQAARARPIVLSTEGDPLETLAVHFDRRARNAP